MRKSEFVERTVEQFWCCIHCMLFIPHGVNVKLVPCGVRRQDILQQPFVWPVLKQDSSQGYIYQQFQMIFWIRNDTVISIYALICLLLGGIDGNQLRKGVHRPFWDHKILLDVEYSLLRGL